LEIKELISGFFLRHYIYVTIYQVIFDQFIVSSEVKNTLQGTIDEPVEIIIVILPSFISIWIAVVLFRLRMEEL